jgi:hypothetical protein
MTAKPKTQPKPTVQTERRQWPRERPHLILRAKDRLLPGFARTVDTWPEEMLRPITEIKRYDNNPRQNEQAVKDVVDSLRNFGARQPIVVDGERVIVVGDTRFLAALHLGWPRFPIHIAANLTPEEARAYRIADNKIGERAEWDFPRLKGEFVALLGLGTDLALTGFRDFELEPIMMSGEPFTPGQGGPPDLTMRQQLAFSPEQYAVLKDAIAALAEPPDGVTDGVTQVCREYIRLRRP